MYRQSFFAILIHLKCLEIAIEARYMQRKDIVIKPYTTLTVNGGQKFNKQTIRDLHTHWVSSMGYSLGPQLTPGIQHGNT